VWYLSKKKNQILNDKIKKKTLNKKKKKKKQSTIPMNMLCEEGYSKTSSSFIL
jgi:hypothetical protein